jgi:hypothetical protein
MIFDLFDKIPLPIVLLLLVALVWIPIMMENAANRRDPEEPDPYSVGPRRFKDDPALPKPARRY